ncbi:FAD assembly factor SdhE [Methylovirgula sp. 4M-Z18]|uniref:FAD assembly factor SdhE n=1 Tax=Methylovirgula sp. 4M-Z18 TaxID=2293567 RepID=UPI000E2E6341|nr:succinate dehydrogenase assembly factor 2 [Methylovirgula sp. 4M-Z18]RFB80946.1 succinate dehydrogenase assembly factor 2 [Methylovirgula sp. 4M-Z18]
MGTQISSADLDPRRRKALYRAWHRGMREMDLIMGAFADAEIGGMADADLDDFEALIEAQDQDMLNWMTDKTPVPAAFDTPVFWRMKAFHTRLKPVHL